jgi:CMP-N-acetylneuraminic acid synthetase
MACDVLVTVQATSPLLAAKDLFDAKLIYENQGLHSLLTAVRTKRFFWTDECAPINYNPKHRPRRQDFKGTLMENGSFYFSDVKLLLQEECRLVGKIGIFEMDEATTVEIDEPNDWGIVETLLKSRFK